ncbi:MAG: hypothetical protein NTZ10_02640 [Candidatus Saganbacteria bacterium]|nr:hypothetical protein [Candidatus Saganbacteria bacterium]
MDKTLILDQNFVDDTLKLKSLLLPVKQKFDAFDKTSPTIQQQIYLIEKNKDGIFKNIDNLFANIWEIYNNLPLEAAKEHQKYFQEELVKLFDVSPYNKRVYEKPLGYAGDYITMLYLYDNGYEGDTTYGKFIHRYSMRVPTAIANRNRKDFYKEHINNILKIKPDAKIASIASGPAIELIEILKENPLAEKAVFSCLDFENQSLEYVKNQVYIAEGKTGKKFRVNYINSDIRTLLKSGKIDRVLDNQNLIYCSGLIDYFNNKIASKMIEVLFGKINEGDELVIGNVSDKDSFIAYTEILGEWYIYRRSKEDMLKLTENLINKSIEIEFEKETQMNIFLVIKKP